MKGTLAGRRRSARTLIGVAAVGSMLLAGPAYADDTPGMRGTNLQFAYSPPAIADNQNHVVWHWTLTNPGQEVATRVTLTQRLDPPLTIVRVSDQCVLEGTVIRCRFDRLAPGEVQQGEIEADLPPDQATLVRINGQVTWQQGVVQDSTSAVTPDRVSS